MSLPNAVLKSVVQDGSNLKATWEPYPQPDDSSVIWGTFHGFYTQGQKTISAIGQFVYADTLALGEMSMPIDPKTKNGAVIVVTLWTSSEENPAVASNSLTFTYNKP